MQLRDFCVHRFSSIAKLEEAHVVALRLYSTAAFRSINTPLRELASGERVEPHHLPVTVAFLDEGVKKLRAVMAGAMPASTVTSTDNVTIQEHSPVTVALFDEGVKKLRAVMAGATLAPTVTSTDNVTLQEHSTANACTDSARLSMNSIIDNDNAYAKPPKVLYRGMRDVVLPREFFEKGGTVRSLLPCTCTRALDAAICG